MHLIDVSGTNFVSNKADAVAVSTLPRSMTKLSGTATYHRIYRAVAAGKADTVVIHDRSRLYNLEHVSVLVAGIVERCELQAARAKAKS